MSLPPGPRRDATVFVVDDDPGVRDALAWLLRSRRLDCERFDSAEAFAPRLEAPRHPACVLLDVRMPGLSGLALFDQMAQLQLLRAWPVIFLTGHADVPTAVDAVKRGAFDFFEKPFSDNALVDRIEQALDASLQHWAQERDLQQVRACLADLTDREQAVMQRVLDGLSNKQIAEALAISVRTVEVHRSRVFDKMAVRSAVELATRLRGLDRRG